LTWAYVVCHHGASDYIAGCDLTAPGENGAVDIVPDSVTNIIAEASIASTLVAQGGTVNNIVLTNPGTQYLDINPNYDGLFFSAGGDKNLTLGTGVLPPGIEEDLSACTPAQPFCDTLFVYVEWTPNDLNDLYSNGPTADQGCDNNGNIDPADELPTYTPRNYYHKPTIEPGYVPFNGFQNAGTSGVPEGSPGDEGTAGLDPDPEFGDCGSTAANTCAAGPAEDCSSRPISFDFRPDVSVEKNTVAVTPNPTSADLFDVEYEIIVTNPDDIALANVQLTDDLIATFGSSAAYILPSVDTTVIPNPVTGAGFPTVNPAFDGNADQLLFDGTSGDIQPGESVRVTFIVTVDRTELPVETDITNVVRTDADDCLSGVWCVSDTSSSVFSLPFIDVALAKTVMTPGPYSIGQTVTYNIAVVNQGTEELRNVEVSEYMPTCGLTFAPSNAPAWTMNMAGTIATQTIPVVAIGQTENITVDFIVGACTSTPAYLNIAEISHMEDTAGRDVSMSDIDSQADNDPTNDAGGDPESANDNFLDGDGSGAPGDSDAAGDEDDADPAILTVPPSPVCSILNEGPVCAGLPITISENGGDGDSWSWIGPDGFVSTDQSITIDPAVAGDYEVTVTNEFGFFTTCSTTVVLWPAVEFTGVVSDALCNLGGTGEIDLTVSAGTAPYTFDWDNDAVGDNDDTEDLTGLTAGDYTVIVTDANGCVFSELYGCFMFWKCRRNHNNCRCRRNCSISV